MMFRPRSKLQAVYAVRQTVCEAAAAAGWWWRCRLWWSKSCRRYARQTLHEIRPRIHAFRAI